GAVAQEVGLVDGQLVDQPRNELRPARGLIWSPKQPRGVQPRGQALDCGTQRGQLRRPQRQAALDANQLGNVREWVAHDRSRRGFSEPRRRPISGGASTNWAPCSMAAAGIPAITALVASCANVSPP